MAQQGEQKGIDLMTLPPQQLVQIKEQLEGQIEQFSGNFQDLQVRAVVSLSFSLQVSSVLPSTRPSSSSSFSQNIDLGSPLLEHQAKTICNITDSFFLIIRTLFFSSDGYFGFP